jgi:hypothetical protein
MQPYLSCSTIHFIYDSCVLGVAPRRWDHSASKNVFLVRLSDTARRRRQTIVLITGNITSTTQCNMPEECSLWQRRHVHWNLAWTLLVSTYVELIVLHEYSLAFVTLTIMLVMVRSESAVQQCLWLWNSRMAFCHSIYLVLLDYFIRVYRVLILSNNYRLSLPADTSSRVLAAV